MRKRRFLAFAAALAACVSLLSAPAAVFATEPGDDYEDISDDEQQEGEQTTIPAPGVDDEPGSSGGGNNSGGTSGGTSGGSQQGQGGASTASKSSDSSLASLGISPGRLSPAFSPDTYEYTATVDADVTRVSIPARPNSSKAVIASVSGAKSIRPGTNTVKVVVEAENGKTSTYTITVQCGQGTQDAPTPQPGNTDAQEPASVKGEISDVEPKDETQSPDLPDEADDEKDEDGGVSFDSNGYLIYKGEAYIPSELMPEGEYVSLEKYNSLYEQAQADKTKSNRLMIVFVVGLVLLVIVVINLAFKLRDVRQDAKLGIGGMDDEDELFPREPKVTKASRMRAGDTTVMPDVKPEQTRRGGAKSAERVKGERTRPAEKARPAERTKPAEKTRPAAPARAADRKKSARADRELEILDLNDL